MIENGLWMFIVINILIHNRGYCTPCYYPTMTSSMILACLLTSFSIENNYGWYNVNKRIVVMEKIGCLSAKLVHDGKPGVDETSTSRVHQCAQSTNVLANDCYLANQFVS